ncbi:hypothetical protein L7F22_022757 [Adiantum nelumboides]|nr:hypothetical protein [Adiantum nelumboides]
MGKTQRVLLSLFLLQEGFFILKFDSEISPREAFAASVAIFHGKESSTCQGGSTTGFTHSDKEAEDDIAEYKDYLGDADGEPLIGRYFKSMNVYGLYANTTDPIAVMNADTCKGFDLQIGIHLKINSIPMAGDEVFIVGKAEDVDKFIQRIELSALKSNRDDGAFKVRLVSLLLEGKAREWYENRLKDEKKANWDALSQALREEFGRIDNPEDLWRELSNLHQGEQEDINVFVNRFEACWRAIIKRHGENQMPTNFLKKYRFVVLVHHGIREKVELKDPRTYDEAVRIAREQWTKKVRRHEMANKEREGVIHQRDAYVPMYNVVEPLPLDIYVERDAHVEAPRVNNRGQEALHQNIQRLIDQIGNLNLAMQQQVVHEVDEDDEVDVLANKRTRAQRSKSEGHLKEERARAKLRRDEDKGKAPMEEGESSKQAKARARRRKIGMDDFWLGKGQFAYDLLEDLKNKRAKISYGQLLHLSSSMRRHWHKLASIRRRVNKAYMDGEAQVCVMIEKTMQQLGLELTGKSMFSVKMENSSRVKCLGVIHDLEINFLGQRAVVDIHTMLAKLGAYPVILGRPWLIAMRSWQDWYRGCIDLFVDWSKDKKIRYDMKTSQVLEIDDEPVMHQELSSSTHDMYDSYSSASSTCTDDEVYDQSLLDLDVDLCGIHVSTKNSEK